MSDTTTIDPFLYSPDAVRKQIETARFEFGFFRLRFYTENGILAKRATDTISEFYLYPSGGALRDKDMNIVHYDSKFDFSRGFLLPKNGSRSAE